MQKINFIVANVWKSYFPEEKHDDETHASVGINFYLCLVSDLNLFNKLISLPENLKKEVSDFIEFLSAKNNKENPKKTKRVSGLAKGMIKMSDDFDEPLEDFKEYM